MVDVNNLTVSDAAPGTVNDEKAESAREKIKSAVSGEKSTPEPPKSGGKSKGGNTTKIAKSLEKMYGSIGMTVFTFDQSCGKTIMENAQTMAQSLDDLAKENQSVKRVLEKVVETSAWGSVLTAHAPLAMAVFTHHGGNLIPKPKQKTNKDHSQNSSENETDETKPPSVGMYVPPTMNAE